MARQMNPVLEQVRRWREGSLWSAALHGGQALRLELVMASEPRIMPDRIEETGVYIGPIEHDPALCRRAVCICWCVACDRQHSHPASPEYVPETVDQRIERVIASVPELCQTCMGSGFIETVGHDGDEWFAERESCPTCSGLVPVGEGD